MAILVDAIDEGGLMNDGDWILSENMDSNGSIGVIQLKHIGVGEFIDKDFSFITEETFFKLGCNEVLPGDILISRMADPIARACIVPRLPFRCVTAVDVTILRVGCNSDPRYICYLCNSDIVRQQAERAVRGTTRARITRTELQNFPIPLPPLPEQKHIANIQGKANRLRRLRRYARELSDTYLQSVFLEIFGDPVTNPMGWDRVFLEKLAYGHNGIVDGPYGSSVNTEVDYIPEGEIPVIRTKNVGVFEFIEDDLKFITRKKFESLTRSRVIPGDIVLTKVGTIGQMCIFPGRFEEAVLSTTGSCKITPDTSQVDRTFLIHSLYAMRGYMNQVASKAVQSFLNMTMVKEIPIIIPPRHLQDEFAIIASKYERLRSQQHEAERQAEHLFQTLLHRAFKMEAHEQAT